MDGVRVSHHTLRRGKAALVVSALALGTVTAVSAGSGWTGNIYACVNNTSGTIKIVGATDTCNSGDVALNWNQQGPPGPAGPQGPKGDSGPQGQVGTERRHGPRRSTRPEG